jgi:hypothetical protein
LKGQRRVFYFRWAIATQSLLLRLKCRYRYDAPLTRQKAELHFNDQHVIHQWLKGQRRVFYFRRLIATQSLLFGLACRYRYDAPLTGQIGGLQFNDKHVTHQWLNAQRRVFNFRRPIATQSLLLRLKCRYRYDAPLTGQISGSQCNDNHVIHQWLNAQRRVFYFRRPIASQSLLLRPTSRYRYDAPLAGQIAELQFNDKHVTHQWLNAQRRVFNFRRPIATQSLRFGLTCRYRYDAPLTGHISGFQCNDDHVIH